MSLLSGFFRRYRELSGLTVHEVASEIGLAPLQVQNYEDGVAQIRLEHVFALMNLLNVPPDELVSLLYDIAANATAGMEVAASGRKC